MSLDPSLFADVADTLGIAHPAIVEKDYYAVQLLKLLPTLKTPNYTLVFAGGTCLTKAHQNTYRMSEDIDIKLIPSEKTLQESRTAQRQLRRVLHKQIVDLFENSDMFRLIQEPIRRNEYKFQQFMFEYPTHHGRFDALRPHLQLDLVESTLLQAPLNSPIGSLYAEVVKDDHEVIEFSCAALESTAAEKFISLLRRTAAFARDHDKKDEPTLIRHLYDLHLILTGGAKIELIKEIVPQVIAIDAADFGNQHPEFRDDPVSELIFGFEKLIQEPQYKQRYAEFIGPLVYHPDPADWDASITSFKNFMHSILNDRCT